jgi:hypothetical protein
MIIKFFQLTLGIFWKWCFVVIIHSAFTWLSIHGLRHGKGQTLGFCLLKLSLLSQRSQNGLNKCTKTKGVPICQVISLDFEWIHWS